MQVHNEYYSAYEIDDLLQNPEKHFYFDGVKYATLAVVREAKSRRVNHEREFAKDLQDIELIDAHTSNFP